MIWSRLSPPGNVAEGQVVGHDARRGLGPSATRAAMLFRPRVVADAKQRFIDRAARNDFRFGVRTNARSRVKSGRTLGASNPGPRDRAPRGATAGRKKAKTPTSFGSSRSRSTP